MSRRSSLGCECAHCFAGAEEADNLPALPKKRGARYVLQAGQREWVHSFRVNNDGNAVVLVTNPGKAVSFGEKHIAGAISLLLLGTCATRVVLWNPRARTLTDEATP